VLDDPTITDTDLVGGWFQGTRDKWGIDAAAEVIAAVAGQQGVPLSRILLYGSSIGGFSGLMLAARLRGAYAIAEVPQTDLRIYPYMRHIRSMAELVYGSPDVQSVAEQFIGRFSVLERWRMEGIVPRCHIIHEVSDEPHGSSQFTPFATQIIANNMAHINNVTFEILNRGCGHAALSLDLALPRIKAALDSFV
jgi:pimeloyl-ACP methyl ester carboxylesterase